MAGDAVAAVGAALDNVWRGFAGAEGGGEFLFDAGDIGIKDPLGLGAEGFQGVVSQGLVIETRFLLVELAEFLPVEAEPIGGDAFRVGQEEAEERALHRIERNLDCGVRQQECAPSTAGEDLVYAAAPIHNVFAKFCRRTFNS